MRYEKKKVIRNVMSMEEYLKRQRIFWKENKREPEVYSFELSSDSFLESLVKSVNP